MPKNPKKEHKETIQVVSRAISASEFERFHEYCVSPSDVQAYINAANKKGWYIPKELKPVCNHPEMGMCFHGQPNQEQLKEINDKLTGVKNDPEIDREIADTRIEKIAKEEAPKTSEKPAKTRYFCLSCSDWHNIGDKNFETHKAHMRKRGRPKK